MCLTPTGPRTLTLLTLECPNLSPCSLLLPQSSRRNPLAFKISWLAMESVCVCVCVHEWLCCMIIKDFCKRCMIKRRCCVMWGGKPGPPEAPRAAFSKSFAHFPGSLPPHCQEAPRDSTDDRWGTQLMNHTMGIMQTVRLAGFLRFCFCSIDFGFK